MINSQNSSNDSNDHPEVIEAEAISPLSKIDETLLECFAKDVAAQATRLDELARQIITLSIAVPGIFAAALKLVHGDKAVSGQPLSLQVAFVFWLAALGLALRCLRPEKYEIDPESLTEIHKYFSDSARRKLFFITCATICCFLGISLAVFSIF